MVHRNFHLLLKLLLLVLLMPFTCLLASLLVYTRITKYIYNYSAFIRLNVSNFGTYIGDVNTSMTAPNRPLCTECKSKPRAYGYRKGSKVYWRRKCDSCIRKSKNKKIGGVTALQRSGYSKKSKCELCGFKAVDKAQLDVFFVDGSLRNVNPANLKTVCANCQRLSGVRRLGWRVGDLVADE